MSNKTLNNFEIIQAYTELLSNVKYDEMLFLKHLEYGKKCSRLYSLIKAGKLKKDSRPPGVLYKDFYTLKYYLVKKLEKIALFIGLKENDYPDYIRKKLEANKYYLNEIKIHLKDLLNWKIP